jgi:hypothetical protein
MRKLLIYQNNLAYWRSMRTKEVNNFFLDWDKLSFYESMVQKYQLKVDKLLKKEYI